MIIARINPIAIKKISAFILFVIISVFCTAQKKITSELLIRAGNSMIVGKWRNFSAYDAPAFKRNITPTLELGANMIFGFTGKAGKKIVYDEMYGSGFYLADKISISIGASYVFCGQGYKDMVRPPYTDIIFARKVRLQYLKMPIRFEFIKGKEHALQLVYTLGFYGGYLSWYKEQYSETSSNNYTKTEITKGYIYSETSSDGTLNNTYSLSARPYQSFDYGMSIGVGAQKKLNADWTLQVLLIGQIGFADIKNTSVTYTKDTVSVPYYDKNPNSIISHKNVSLAITAGLKRTFQWVPKPKEERKRFRIFRLKQ